MITMLKRWGICDTKNAGESAVIFYFSGQTLSEQNHKVQYFSRALFSAKPEWIIEIVPAFDSIMVCFDCLRIDQYRLYEFIHSLPENKKNEVNGTHHCISVCYDRGNQFDLQNLSRALNCSINDIIRKHAKKLYTAYAVGFSPGFAYLGEIDNAIQVPRLKKPRIKVPKGAVAIADSYTAVYPEESPGGWHLIGLVSNEQPSMFERDIQVGDTVEFVDSSND